MVEIATRGKVDDRTPNQRSAAKRTRYIENLYDLRRRIHGLLREEHDMGPTSRYAMQQAVVACERELKKMGKVCDPLDGKPAPRIELARLKNDRPL